MHPVFGPSPYPRTNTASLVRADAKRRKVRDLIASTLDSLLP
jgi:hypothetical protein